MRTRRARVRTTRVEYLLPHARETVFWARWLTAAFLTRNPVGGAASGDPADAYLIVTELVANVTRHTRSSCRLRLYVAAGALTVEVSDDSPDRPRFRPPGPGDESGRGLLIVCALARTLDVLDTPTGGKTIRATLSAARPRGSGLVSPAAVTWPGV
ncbi:ATP-binding protein [Streptomyces albofaciens]|uniref:ATP-binding protein n=1 Tax=Streptomyces albofaciens TaxID=66866 RepID=UPI00142EBFF2|nr:ATP-binding protein [Streptomyces albofaciens]